MDDILEEHTITVTRMITNGSHVDGVYVDGTTTTCDIKCNVQPVNPNELINLPEAQRRKNAVKVYSADELKMLSLSTKRKADRFTYEGKTFEVHDVKDYSKLNIPHYQSFAAEIDYNETDRKP